MTPTPARLAARRLAPLALLLLACAVVLWSLWTLIGFSWPPEVRCELETCREGREWVASTLTILVLLGGLYQYWQAQLWKRAEFVAAELEKFLAQPAVRKTTVMIDWAARNVNLFDSLNPDPKTWPLVTRTRQSSALLPHQVGRGPRVIGPDQSGNLEDSDLARYTLEEVAIRDAYDTFLDGLERFGGYLTTGLVTADDLRPYLGYWIDDIASEPTIEKGTSPDDPLVKAARADAIWTCMLFAYVHFYGYAGVQDLFRRFGHDIRVNGDLFGRLLDMAGTRTWAVNMRAELKLPRTSGSSAADQIATGPAPARAGQGGHTQMD